MLHTFLHHLDGLSLVEPFNIGGVGWGSLEYCLPLPKFYMWDSLISIIGNFLNAIPVGPSNIHSGHSPFFHLHCCQQTLA